MIDNPYFIPLEYKVAIWDKTKGRCWYCGEKVEIIPKDKKNQKRRYVTDHIIPRKKGGPDSLNNIVPSCASCNNTKNNHNVEYLRLVLALRTRGAPSFTIEQMVWILDNFKLPYYKFYGEKDGEEKSFDLEYCKKILLERKKKKTL